MSKYMSTSEICDRFRKSSRTIARWQEVRGFPKPAMRSMGSENLYLRSQVEAWEESNLCADFKDAG